MSNIIKLKMPKGAGLPGSSRPSIPTPTGTSSGIKLKLTNSQPPTPIDAPASEVLPSTSEKKQKRPYTKKTDGASSKKRAAEDDITSPAAKRIQSGGLNRRLSLKLGPGQGEDKAKIALAKKKASVPRIIDIRARQKAPPRAKGIGYDSEDSDTEKDPAIQQALVLRMQPGEDAEYLRQAIADGKIGPHPSTGDADVSLKFVEKSFRRAVVKVRGNMYAAVLVDLPCIIETMKSFDKKGWWKVADCCQMLFVLGRCSSDDEARTFKLPREVDKNNFNYAHGLTPPLHYVRKRRWRPRPNFNDAVEAEEQAQRLLELDRAVEESGGTTSYSIKKSTDTDQVGGSQYGDDYEDAEGEEDDAVETVEADQMEYEFEEEDGADLEAQLAAQMAFADDDDDAAGQVVESPMPIGYEAASVAPSDAVEPTPVGTPAPVDQTQYDVTSDEDESDEDDDDIDVFDEDAAAKSAERAQQMEEVADLEQEIARTRQKAQAMTNQLLKTRELRKLAGLEEDLKAKKVVFGLEEE